MKKNKYYAKSATRVDLAGGTLDLWPLSILVKGATTVNCSIDCFTQVTFTPGNRLKIIAKSPDFSFSFVFSKIEDLFKAPQPELSLFKESLSFLQDSRNALGEWLLESESPAGSGLGGSSSLLISILKVLLEIEDRRDLDQKKIIAMARDIETKVLKSPAGIQDYFSPLEMGLNSIEFSEGGFKRKNLNPFLEYWQPRFLIVDSQIKHHSGFNNWEIFKRFIEKDLEVVRSLETLAEVAHEVVSSLKNKNDEGLKKAFIKELEARKKVSKSYINKELSCFLDHLKKISPSMGIKVCGAGGGGCVLLLVEPNKREETAQALDKENIKVLPFNLQGSLV